ncbi:ChaB family protein [Saccharomonospora halophila]|uniref:ChaB family protein n=1 Tax=Saccharomonospora halophila TaxID=129922 RepID=UPI00037D61DC|nr:ChaB family protein [Saccharomonospora halophila]
MPGRQELPSTLRRSPEKAQRTWIEAHDSAVETYGEGRRAHQTAYSALKHSFEKVGDRWEPKEDKGPSDAQAERGAGQRATDTAGGVDANASKQHLYERARQLDIPGRSSMSKKDLVDALQKASGRRTAEAREEEKAGGSRRSKRTS